ncbi:hypothetical protein LguiB_018688 [Lonicera macranthoides]
MVVGMGGIEGIVVGMVGSEVDGSGGSATFGMVGIEGKVGIWVLGKGGKANFGRVGPVGSVGKGTAGNGGSVVLGRVGMASDGGSVGSVGREDCSRWRAARVVWRLESTNATIKVAIVVIWTHPHNIGGPQPLANISTGSTNTPDNTFFAKEYIASIAGHANTAFGRTADHPIAFPAKVHLASFAKHPNPIFAKSNIANHAYCPHGNATSTASCFIADNADNSGILLALDHNELRSSIEKFTFNKSYQALDGGGKKIGIVGMVVGMIGIEGIVGKEVADNGGSDSEGTVGSAGFGRDGIWVLGKGGNVGFGRVGAVGRVGNGGSVAVGSVGITGNGGIVGSVGFEVCSKWRVARVVWKLESINAMIKAAIVWI